MAFFPLKGFNPVEETKPCSPCDSDFKYKPVTVKGKIDDVLFMGSHVIKGNWNLEQNM